MIVPEFRTARGARQLAEAVTMPEHGFNNLLAVFFFSCYLMVGDYERLNGSHELRVMVM